MAQDFLNQSDRDVQRLVEDLEDVIRSPLENDMASVKQETAKSCYFSEKFHSSRRKIPKNRLGPHIASSYFSSKITSFMSKIIIYY